MGRIAKDINNIKHRRVFMVELKVPMEDTPDVTFFGSKKAIFEYFGNKTLGLSYNSSRTRHFDWEHPYENARCRIIEGEVITNHSGEVVNRREREGREEIECNGDYAHYIERIKSNLNKQDNEKDL